jgi:hypothetical protein
LRIVDFGLRIGDGRTGQSAIRIPKFRAMMRLRDSLRHLGLGILLLAPSAAQAAAGMQLAAGGRARCVIVRQPGASPAERHAAEELARALARVTGARFPVVEAGAEAPPAAILVGPGPAARACFPEVPLDRFGRERWVIRTRGGRLLLAGGRPRGTLYAVYRFLAEQCGCRWWAPWAALYPRHAELAIPDLDREQEPAFAWREVYWQGAFDGEWAARNAVNGAALAATEATGGKVRYLGPSHSFYHLVPPEPYFREHPEWFSLVGGKRTYGAQLCLTNRALQAFLAQRIEERLREAPDTEILSVAPDDRSGNCECEVCRRIDREQGSAAGSLLACVNFVAEQVGQHHPEVQIATLAYQATRPPPRSLAARPNVLVRYCPIEANWEEPLDTASNQVFAEELRGWKRVAPHLHAWLYAANFNHYGLPHPDWFTLGPNLRFLKRQGVEGVFVQGVARTGGGEMAELRAWLLARLLRDPEQDDRLLIDEFLRGYYSREAAPFVRQYLDLMHGAAKGFELTTDTAPDAAQFLRFPVLARAEWLWQSAEAATRRSPEVRWRVRQSHAATLYAFLVRWSALRRECAAAGAAWPLSASRREVARDWLARVTGAGPPGWPRMTRVAELGPSPEEFAARLASEPPPGRAVPAASPERGAATTLAASPLGGLVTRPGALLWLAALPLVGALCAAWRPKRNGATGQRSNGATARERMFLDSVAPSLRSPTPWAPAVAPLLPGALPFAAALLLYARVQPFWTGRLALGLGILSLVSAGGSLVLVGRRLRLARQPRIAILPGTVVLVGLAGFGAWMAPYARARFTGALASLAGADLRAANLYQANLQAADLRRADLRGAFLRGAWLGRANLDGADLRGADLRGTTLAETFLRGADLRGADMEGASIVDTAHANLTGARYDGATRWPVGFDPRDHGAALQP